MRIFMVWLVPLLLPFVVWWLWAKFVARKRAELGQGWSDAPYVALIVIAVLLCGASVATFGGLSVAPAGSAYEPAHMEDGKLMPGRLVEQPGHSRPVLRPPGPRSVPEASSAPSASAPAPTTGQP